MDSQAGNDHNFKVAKSKKKEGVIEGDHITYLNIYNKYNGIKNEGSKIAYCKTLKVNHKTLSQVTKIRLSLITELKKFGITILESDDYDDPVAILKSLLAGFF